MGRPPRINIGNQLYHVINRANARLPIFFCKKDYVMFEKILEEGQQKFNMRIIAYCLMPNHFHLVLYPRQDGELQKFMQWITLTHTQRWHAQNKTIGTGHLYQGRYKTFLIEENDQHLLVVIAYVERNPLRAKLVSRSEDWNFSSLNRRISKDPTRLKFLSEWPIQEPFNYLELVNYIENSKNDDVIRYSVNKGKPFGTEQWSDIMIEKYGLEMTTRKDGRPKKNST